MTIHTKVAHIGVVVVSDCPCSALTPLKVLVRFCVLMTRMDALHYLAYSRIGIPLPLCLPTFNRVYRDQLDSQIAQPVQHAMQGSLIGQ